MDFTNFTLTATQWMIASYGPLILGALIIVAGINRIRQKLSADAKPTLWTYVNELGGYLLFGPLLIGLGLFALWYGN